MLDLQGSRIAACIAVAGRCRKTGLSCAAPFSFNSRHEPMRWYLVAFKKYAVFAGRASRAEFWWFFLINLLITALLEALDQQLGLFDLNGFSVESPESPINSVDQPTGTLDPNSGYGLLSGLYTLGVLLPTIAVAVRRLHDSNRTGLWLWIGLIPVIGPIILLAFFILEGTSEANRFGVVPRPSDA